MNSAADPRLRLAFDVTQLGRGRFYPRSRTGIFRVSAELARALSRRSELSLAFTALECRGEAEEELARLGLDTRRLRRSAVDRALFPLLRAAIVPADLPLTKALSDARRKTLRTFVQLLELFPGGAPRSARDGVDVWHSPYLPASWLRLPREARARTVVTVHDLLPLTHPEYFSGSDTKQLQAVIDDLKGGAWAHCVSEATRTALLELAPDVEQRSFVVSLAADSERFYVASAAQRQHAQRELGLTDAPYVLCLGTLDPRKNISTLLAAFSRLRSTCPELRLVVAGATARSSAPWDHILAKFPEARAACVFVGFVGDDSLAGLYSGARAFLFPSLAEGFGLPVLEAMQCGVPVVVSNRTSLPEIVANAGLLLHPEAVEDWASAIAELHTQPQKRALLQQRSLERSRAFGWELSAASLAREYRRIDAASR